jgi:carbonic anhydrase
MEFFTNKTIPELLEKSLETARLTDSGWVDVGYELGSSAGRGIDWLTFEDARASVVDDVRRIREHPQLVPSLIIRSMPLATSWASPRVA